MEGYDRIWQDIVGYLLIIRIWFEIISQKRYPIKISHFISSYPHLSSFIFWKHIQIVIQDSNPILSHHILLYRKKLSQLDIQMLFQERYPFIFFYILWDIQVWYPHWYLFFYPCINPKLSSLIRIYISLDIHTYILVQYLFVSVFIQSYPIYPKSISFMLSHFLSENILTVTGTPCPGARDAGGRARGPAVRLHRDGGWPTSVQASFFIELVRAGISCLEPA